MKGLNKEGERILEDYIYNIIKKAKEGKELSWEEVTNLLQYLNLKNIEELIDIIQEDYEK
ncbi:hypothetical protein [Sulfolobus sp. E11-6]|uniref:hypothetical protein n=1 Tax=Sulfolobus sp. E11-6 TaxID=2663020 RepID=UPI001297A753|nr:hypothetical protein [Sulfolobus sp. E11-6]QGA68537.1 hypothetical protein GFS33_07185 [Sulfolobus sp. E11-6]